jgi:hypothetical protein
MVGGRIRRLPAQAVCELRYRFRGQPPVSGLVQAAQHGEDQAHVPSRGIGERCRHELLRVGSLQGLPHHLPCAIGGRALGQGTPGLALQQRLAAPLGIEAPTGRLGGDFAAALRGLHSGHAGIGGVAHQRELRARYTLGDGLQDVPGMRGGRRTLCHQRGELRERAPSISGEALDDSLGTAGGIGRRRDQQPQRVLVRGLRRYCQCLAHCVLRGHVVRQAEPRQPR